LALAAALAGISTGAGFANPQGGTVVSGGASIGPAGKSLIVRQTTDRAIINWKSFSTGTGESTRFVQPSAAAATLNRVTGGDPSVLLGRLQSNGQVYLINPNGITVGPNGVIDTRGGFVASTLDVPDAAFLRGGSLTFSGGSTATITNLGTIKTTNGDVALIALHVVNGGSISAPGGQALLAGGNEVLYVPDGDSSVVIRPEQAPGGANVDNSGRIAAASAQLKAAGSPYALAVNNTGAVEATGITAAGGRLVLSGGDGDVQSGGTLTAPGGTATLTGGRVAVTGRVDVSAPTGGGTIAVQGTNAAIVTPTGSLAANATQQGNGGRISVTSRGAANFAGAASATGGPQGGNGGTAEISGRTLGVTGTVALKAPKGKAGSLLFDPDEIDVEPGTASPVDIIGGIWSFSQDSGAQTIGTTTIVNLLASGNLTLQAKTSITINGLISATSANTLEFDSPTITVNQPVSIAGGSLILTGKNGGQAPSVGQTLTSAATATIAADSVTLDAFATIGLSGAIQTDLLTVGNSFGSFGQATLTATNSGNAVGTLFLNRNFFSGAVAFANTGALTVEGQSSADGFSITTTGNLTMSLAQPTQLTSSGGQITLASTGGFFNNTVGSTLLSGTGREVIYAASDGNGFSQGGLGFPAYNPVAFGSDPLPGLNQVIYIANSTALVPLAITADTLSRTYGATGPNFTFNNGDTSLASLAIQPQFALLQGSTPVANGTGLPAGTYKIVPSSAISLNNALSFTNGTFTVNPAPLNIVANNATIAFGDAIPPLTADIFGLVNSEPKSVVTGLSVTTTATNGSGVGNYAITPSGATAPNYTITYTAGTLTIGKAALTLTITADDLSRLYGAANPPLTVTYSGFVDGDDKSVVSGLSLTTTATPASPVGTYPILASGATAANYNIALVNGTLTVIPAPLSITANNNTRLYGGSDPAFSASFNGLVNGEDPSVVSGLRFSTNATSTSPVGNGYTITPFGATASNYTISYAPGTLSVTPAPLLITADDATKTYGAANPPFSASFAGLVNGEDMSVVSGLRLSTTATSVSGVGNYTITPSGASAGNYSITYAAGTLNVTPAPLLITVNDASRLYGAANPDFIPTMSGFVNSDGPSVVSGLQLATTAISSSNVGTYPITGSGATAANYAVSYAPGTLTVNPAPLSITADNASAVYAQSFPTFTARYSGLVNGNVAGVVSGLQFVANGVPGSAVGSYSIIPFGATATNYSISFVNGTLSITPAPLTITADNHSRLYGAANPALTATYSGLVNGDTSSAVTGLQLSSPATSGSNVGAYPIIPSGASAANYAITYSNGTLTVNPASLTITANNASTVYGSAIPAFTAGYSGFVNGDTPLAVSGLTFSPPPSSANAGAYAIVPSGAAAANYAISYRNGTLTITPASLTINPNGTQTYGGTPTVTYAYSGFVNGDTAASLTTPPTFTTPAGQFDSVNFYPLFASSAASPNYTISYLPGTLRVTPASINVTPADVTRLYGAPPTHNTETFSGFVNGDTASTVFSTLPIADTGSQLLSAGTHPLPLFQGGVVKNPNYVEVDRAGTVTVNPAPLTITANATKVYGAPISSAMLLDSDFVGFVNFDTQASLTTQPTILSQATSSSPVGSRLVTSIVGAADPNYTITVNPGIMTITPAPLTIVANDATSVVNQPLPTLTGTFTGLVAGDTPASSGYGLAVAPFAATTVGTYSINLTGNNPNYTLVLFKPGILNVLTDATTLTIFTSQPITNLTPSNTQPTMTMTTTETLAPAPVIVPLSTENITVRVADDPYFKFGPLSDDVLAQAAAEAGVTVDDINAALADPSTRTVEMAVLLPYLYGELNSILTQPQSGWTWAQSVYVDDVLNFINQQRQTAAIQAENDYNDWYQQQYAAQQRQLAGLSGITYVEMAAVLASTPPIPPDTFLNEAALGMAMTGSQAQTYAGIAAASADLASASGATTTQNGVELSAAAGSIAKQAGIVIKSLFASGMGINGKGVQSLLGAKLGKALLPYAAKTAERTGDILKDATEAAETLGSVSKVLEVGGLVTEVVSNVVSIGVGAYLYGSLDTYNQAFNSAVAANMTPLKVSDLQSMAAPQMYSYLMNMVAAPNTTPPIIYPPSTPQSVYESL